MTDKSEEYFLSRVDLDGEPSPAEPEQDERSPRSIFAFVVATILLGALLGCVLGSLMSWAAYWFIGGL